MKSSVGLIVLGLVAFAAAGEYTRMRAVPAKTYGQSAPTRTFAQPAAAPVKSYAAADLEEEVLLEEEPVQYRTAVKAVVKAPIRVVNEPKMGYGSTSYGSMSSSSARIENERVAEEQAQSAHYSFGSAIDDGIMDHSHVRQETREGTKVQGSYAYSDGYFKRVVNYEADENGYRVVGETVEPISEDGPNVDLVNGKVDVHTQIGGVDSQYTVTAQEIPYLAKSQKAYL